ncbi:MAG: hypothetical protein H6Q05_4722 [Acidobacteria bacterium]|nr:hypothetical protein [Acidobacteriota bacterium]
MEESIVHTRLSMSRFSVRSLRLSVRAGWHTAEALPDIIAIVRIRGYSLVTVGELLADLKKPN